ncbi:hypothetical protein TUM20983_51900 [Mycobacterium antarcticum]|uniref:hypothetical protein n=1 Tax=Mycolicibacterium sp. TUM20983 TaxID=3023369 RepID=UPI00238AA877|nr:hypothetical protein [Mycolicibacterium sp. TUM20983]GLP78080.1 hypothetical protein TUM20983_51900 [Mycolicibacterium sp. TUM20983]
MTATGTVILVVGPPLSGVGGVVDGLRRQRPDLTVVGIDGVARQRPPDAVLVVVSAVAPVTRSDWVLVAPAAARADLVVGVVAKVDAHREWRTVADADRKLVSAWDARAAAMPWVGVAAAPDVGEPRLGELLAELDVRLADPGLPRRNQLQRNIFRASRGRIVAARRASAARGVLQRARLGLLRFVRDGCDELRAELRDAAAAVHVAGSAGFETLVRTRADRFLTGLDAEIDRVVDAAATELGLEPRRVVPPVPARRPPPEMSRSPATARGLEGRLMAVLGVGFGLGIALASSRLLAGMAPGLAAAGWAAGAAVGLALMAWVVRTRGLLHERALLDRWVTEVVGAVRWHAEAAVAERLLALDFAGAETGSEMLLTSTNGELAGISRPILPESPI